MGHEDTTTTRQAETMCVPAMAEQPGDRKSVGAVFPRTRDVSAHYDAARERLYRCGFEATDPVAHCEMVEVAAHVLGGFPLIGLSLLMTSRAMLSAWSFASHIPACRMTAANAGGFFAAVLDVWGERDVQPTAGPEEFGFGYALGRQFAAEVKYGPGVMYAFSNSGKASVVATRAVSDEACEAMLERNLKAPGPVNQADVASFEAQCRKWDGVDSVLVIDERYRGRLHCKSCGSLALDAMERPLPADGVTRQCPICKSKMRIIPQTKVESEKKSGPSLECPGGGAGGAPGGALLDRLVALRQKVAGIQQHVAGMMAPLQPVWIELDELVRLAAKGGAA